ncbi:MAG: ABC transporter permease [Polyangiaceae bacterium]
MKTLFAKRIARVFFSVWAVLTLSFFVSNVLPSDPARIAAGPQARPADVARIRQEMGADRPVTERYALFWRRLVHVPRADTPASSHRDCRTLGPLHFDLGRSYQQRRPVATILEERLPRSLMLASAALVFQLGLGVFLGSISASASRARKWLTSLLGKGSLLTVSLPTFLTGILLQYVFAHRLGWLPLDGYGQTPWEHAKSLVLPALTLGIHGTAYYLRITQDEVTTQLRSDYIRTARAKGAGALRVLLRHGLRNAVLPIATIAALDLGMLVGSAVVTETVFRFPGIGSLSVLALVDRDGPVLMATVLVSALLIVFGNALADALYGTLDPRVRSR